MRIKQISIGKAFVVVLWLLGGAQRGMAAPILDQSNDPAIPFTTANLFGGGPLVGQTIQAGITGLLTQVDLQLRYDGTPTDDLTISVLSAPSGVPATVLGSVDVPASALSNGAFAWHAIDVSGLSISVTAGTRFALAAQSDTAGGNANQYQWYLSTPTTDAYPTGAAFTGFAPGAWFPVLLGPALNPDFTFRTYVDATAVPEPSLLAFLSLNALALVARARRKR